MIEGNKRELEMMQRMEMEMVVQEGLMVSFL